MAKPNPRVNPRLNPQPQNPLTDPPVFDQALEEENSWEDSDDEEFDSLREDGDLDEDNTLNDGSSAMSDQPSNGPRNQFNGRFSE